VKQGYRRITNITYLI